MTFTCWLSDSVPGGRGVTRMLKVAGRPSEAKTNKTSERITKAKGLRTLSRGYKVLEKEKVGAYQAAAEALALVEERSDRYIEAAVPSSLPWCGSSVLCGCEVRGRPHFTSW